MIDINKLSTYEIIETHDAEEKHTIAVIVDNEFGVLGRVIGLFSSRGYNIHSLTVSEIDPEAKISRITIVTKGTQAVITQIMALLERLIPVYEVHDLSNECPHIERTLGLIKVVSDNDDNHHKAQELADRFGARTIDSTAKSFIFELSDTSDSLDRFITLMIPFGVKEICRTGITAISRGSDYINVDD